MTSTHQPWPMVPLGQVVDVLDSRRKPIKASDRALRPGSVPYYGATGQVGFIDQTLFDEPLILLGEDGAPFLDPLRPKAYLIDGPAWVNNHAHVLRARSPIDRRFVAHYLNHFDYRGYANGTTRLKLTQAAMRHIPVPNLGVVEQRRIVDILEDHLSRLDAADAYLGVVERRLVALKKSVLLHLIPATPDWPLRWRQTTVGQAGRVDLGRQRHPDWHVGDNMRPYLRVANVFEDRIDLRDVKTMHWPGDTFDRFRLAPGDVLLNEGQTPELLGRPALYSGHPPDVAFTNSILRFRALPTVLPEFALLVFRRHMHAGRFTREARITTNIAHLSASRLKPIEFPIPPLREQEHLVTQSRERLQQVSTLGSEVASHRTRMAALRRAVLAAAFSGKLTGRRTDDDVIEELAAT